MARTDPALRRWARRLVPVAVVAAVVAGVVAVVAGRSSSRGGYRIATVATRTVAHHLDAVATIEPVLRASVAFPAAGTVSGVDVSVGDRVVTGRRLATLDTTALTTALHQKQATLAKARLNLSLALSGTNPGAIGGGLASGLGGSGSSRPTARSAGDPAQTGLVAARQAVVDAQAAVDAADTAAHTALASAESVCATVDAQACHDALVATLSAQQDLATAQAALSAAVDDLDTLVSQWADDLSTTTTTTPTTTTSTRPERTTTTTTPGGTSGHGGTGGTGGSGGGTFPSGGTSRGSGSASSAAAATGPTSADLIAYQKQVDAASDAVAVADQALAQAEIVSPIDGTVVSVGLTPGASVTAGSSTATVVVAGSGGFEVTAMVSVDDIAHVKVGQPASVVPDGTKGSIAGRVVRIAAAPDTSGSTTTYRVVIGLTGDTSSLGDGATAALSITTGEATDTLAVPTSAVTVEGTSATVQRLVDGKPVATTVRIGAIGPAWTAVTRGLSAGDQVVLADLSQPLPGSATSSANGATNGSGNRGGFRGPGGFTFNGGRRPGG